MSALVYVATLTGVFIFGGSAIATKVAVSSFCNRYPGFCWSGWFWWRIFH